MRSLNIGCEAAVGNYLVFISGYCVPVDNKWLREIIKPLVENKAVYTYGKQVGNSKSKFSERQLLKKYFPDDSKIPQNGCFVNNANSALKKIFGKNINLMKSLLV